MFSNIVDWFMSLPVMASIGLGILAIIIGFILLLAAGAAAFILFYTFARIIKGLGKKQGGKE